MHAIICTIGDELLIGRTVDTNSAWMAARLNEQGIAVREILSIADTREAIAAAVDRCLARAELVLVTGGLGPTKDDVTKKTLADHFGMRLVEHPEVLAGIERLFARWGKPVNALSRAVALVPDGCTVLMNERGTAAGMWFERDGRVLVSMPGVPYEMKHLMAERVLPRLADRFTLKPLEHRHLLTAGVGESRLAGEVEDLEGALPEGVKLAYLPTIGAVKLRLSAAAGHTAELEDWTARFRERVAPWLYGEGETTLAAAVVERLAARGWQLGVAESCTGGRIASRIVDVPGCSAWFRGGLAAYSYEAKTTLLGVPAAVLAEHGAVSTATVREMLAGALRVFGADAVVAVSGIAGPGGGLPDKPVGTVYIGVATRQAWYVRRFHFPADREGNIELSTVTGLNLLVRLMDGRLDGKLTAWAQG